MENHSLLPQQFSFVRLPKEITVVTDSGTGNILPQEKYKLQLEYRPTQSNVYEEAFIHVRMITGQICARELKLPYVANVTKCPIQVDKSKLEF
jgi:molybdopterin converting factor small subunit